MGLLLRIDKPSKRILYRVVVYQSKMRVALWRKVVLSYSTRSFMVSKNTPSLILDDEDNLLISIVAQILIYIGLHDELVQGVPIASIYINKAGV
jgi:hypothetical protein